MVDAAFPLTMDQLLLPETDPLIREYLDKCSATLDCRLDEANAKPCKRARLQKWVDTHIQDCESRGMDWSLLTGPSLDVMEYFPGMAVLTPREIDLLALKGVRFPHLCKATIELSQAPDRTGGLTSGTSPTATPGMRRYFAHLGRLSVGLEAMHMQGLHYGHRHAALRSFPSALLQDLAGNAFHIEECAVGILTAMCVRACGKYSATVPRGIAWDPERLRDDLWDL